MQLMFPRLELPESIQKKLDLWREGRIAFPQEYIEFHKEYAERVLEFLESRGYTVYSAWMQGVGGAFEDVTMALEAVIESPRTEKLSKIRWNDAQQKFFEKAPGGGLIEFNPDDIYVH